MDSLLWLASKDRSTFLFRRGTQHQVHDSQIDENADSRNSNGLVHTLPYITQLDTRSFTDLFEDFQCSGSEDRSPVHAKRSSRTMANPDVFGPHPTYTPISNLQVGRKATSNPGVSNQMLSTATVIRYDSTGSSSQSQAMGSDISSQISRHSSNSSLMQDPLFAATIPRVEQPTNPPIENPGVKPKTAHSSPASTQVRQTRSNTGRSTITLVSGPPNLDKPLPAGPPSSHSAEDVLNKSPQRPTTNRSSRKQHSRSTTVTFPLPVNISELPKQLPNLSSTDFPPTKTLFRSASHRRVKSANLGCGFDFNGLAPSANMASAQLLDRRALPVSDQPRASMSKKRVEKTVAHRRYRSSSSNKITPNAAELVIYRIMCHLDDPRDLRSLAMVSKGFYHTYQRHESKLVSHLIFKISRPAWELRRSVLTSRASKTFRLSDYQRDASTLMALKSFILVHCGALCKPKTVNGLLGEEADQAKNVDNALWRIWTFCILFGSNSERRTPAATEIDWLNGSRGIKSKALGAGFAIGNGSGLSVDELEDMSEMWQCLHGLLSQYLGRETEARRAGIFDNFHTNENGSEGQHMQEWIAYIMSMGLQVILSLSSGSFEKAKILGLTKWNYPPPEQSRTSFLVSAIAQVYQDRVLDEATIKAAQIALPARASHRPTRLFDDRRNAPPQQQQGLWIDTSANLSQRIPGSFPEDLTASVPRPLNVGHKTQEIRPDCDPENRETAILRSDAPGMLSSPSLSTFPASPTNDPSALFAISMTPTASTKLGATLFPVDYSSPVSKKSLGTLSGPLHSRPQAFAHSRSYSLATLPSQHQLKPQTNIDRNSLSTLTSSSTMTATTLSSMPELPHSPYVRQPQVIDPSDKAILLLVNELGFKESSARRALAMCESGTGVDVQKAIELLIFESTHGQSPHIPQSEQTKNKDVGRAAGKSKVNRLDLSVNSSNKTAVELPTPVDFTGSAPWSESVSRQGTTGTTSSSSQQGSSTPVSRKSEEFCNGDCQRRKSSTGQAHRSLTIRSPIMQVPKVPGASMKKHTRSRSLGHKLDTPISPVTEGSWWSNSSSDRERSRENGSTVSPLLSATSPTSKGGLNLTLSRSTSKAWKVLGVDEQVQRLPQILGDGKEKETEKLRKKKSGVLAMDEYQAKVERKKSMRLLQQLQQQLHQQEAPPRRSLDFRLGTLGGLGGLRSLEKDVEEIEKKVKKNKGKAVGCMPLPADE